jgi:holo-[acyl-carrier protein] synthase
MEKMIIGIGTDIIEISRVEKAVNNTSSFISKFFTHEEITYFESVRFKAETLAGTFAAKEAVAKALGTGFREFGLKDIEVLRDSLGKPYVNCLGKAQKLCTDKNIDKIHVSIAHCKDYAVAYAIAEGSD